MAGLYFEEFEPGQVIEHPTRRTVTETDNILFSTMTLNLAPLHLDAEYSKGTIYGQRLVNSLFILGLVSGITAPHPDVGDRRAQRGNPAGHRAHSRSRHARRGRRPVRQPEQPAGLRLYR